VKFLVALRHAGYARHLESTMRGLCERGHEVVVVVGIEATASKSHVGLLEDFGSELEQLSRDLDGLSVRSGVEPRGSRQRDLGGYLRAWLDYLRYLEPEFADAAKLRERALSNLPTPLQEPVDAAARSPEFRASLAAMLRLVERSLPASEATRAMLVEAAPDAVVVCPLIERRSPQVTYLRAARELGIPSGVCVASWDNLTTSGLLHGDPDLVTVWNDAQRQEAVDLHGIPPERVVVTGAALFDRWFEREPTSSPEEFRRQVGLPADQPFILYACSSGFIAPEEATWIREWIDLVRNGDVPELERIPVLVRPHPHHKLSRDPGMSALEQTAGVVIHPPDGALSLGGREIADYYDAIHHSAAVVGVNTSAMIETAIVGRGVHVLLTPRYRDTQGNLPHFAHLRSSGGGVFRATKKAPQHIAGLARAVHGEDRERAAGRGRRFLEAFVRPHGLDQPATPRMVDELEQLARLSVPATGPAQGPSGEELQTAVETLEAIFGLRRVT
jgi:hypothetical protein